MPKMAEPKALVDRRRGEGPNTLYIRSEGQSESRLPTVRGRRDAVDRSALSRQEKRSPGVMCSVKRHSSTNCHKDVATDGVREATQSHASESPVPCEGRSPTSMADEEG
jgi:hypothetical protein